MAAIKTEKTPGLFGVYLSGIISIWIGGILGFVFMATSPTKAFPSLDAYRAAQAEEDAPRASKPGNAFYIEGPLLRTRSWEAKREQLSAPGPQTVSLSIGELNMWANSRFTAASPPSNLKDAKLLIVPGIPNFAAVEERGFYINLPLSVIILGRSYECMLVAVGTLDTSGFQAESVSFNAAAIPLPSVLGARALESVAQAFQTSEDFGIITQAFERAESVNWGTDGLTFRLR